MAGSAVAQQSTTSTATFGDWVVQCETRAGPPAQKICDMAHVYDCAVQLHVCGGPLATAAALQLEAVIPNFLIHEHHAVSLLEANIALAKYDYQPKNGYFEAPDLPGIGQELSERAIATAETVTIK